MKKTQWTTILTKGSAISLSLILAFLLYKPGNAQMVFHDPFIQAKSKSYQQDSQIIFLPNVISKTCSVCYYFDSRN